MTTITLTMPRGPEGTHTIDLDTLTPMARALAEAIAATPLRRITIKSRLPLRDIAAPGQAEFFYGPDAPELDQPITDSYEKWMDNPTPGNLSIHEILEYEARKMPGYYPVASDGADLPSSAAARDDDGITADQALELLRTHGVHVDKDTWIRQATKGLGGYPAPARHNGYRSLWSAAAIRAYATEQVTV